MPRFSNRCIVRSLCGIGIVISVEALPRAHFVDDPGEGAYGAQAHPSAWALGNGCDAGRADVVTEGAHSLALRLAERVDEDTQRRRPCFALDRWQAPMVGVDRIGHRQESVAVSRGALVDDDRLECRDVARRQAPIDDLAEGLPPRDLALPADPNGVDRRHAESSPPSEVPARLQTLAAAPPQVGSDAGLRPKRDAEVRVLPQTRRLLDRRGLRGVPFHHRPAHSAIPLRRRLDGRRTGFSSTPALDRSDANAEPAVPSLRSLPAIRLLSLRVPAMLAA